MFALTIEACSSMTCVFRLPTSQENIFHTGWLHRTLKRKCNRNLFRKYPKKITPFERAPCKSYHFSTILTSQPAISDLAKNGVCGSDRLEHFGKESAKTQVSLKPLCFCRWFL
jgi:hypothetical protein